MSSVVLSGDTSGTVTLTVPTAAGTNTATLPAATGTVMVSGNMPAFSAYNSTTQSIPSTAFTKMQFQTEEFDTANCFDSTTNYRFTPTIAGYYQINAALGLNVTSAGLTIEIWKNGSTYKRGSSSAVVTGINAFATVSSIIYFNGSTDYVEAYAYQNQGVAASTTTGTAYNYFNGALVRTA